MQCFFFLLVVFLTAQNCAHKNLVSNHTLIYMSIFQVRPTWTMFSSLLYRKKSTQEGNGLIHCVLILCQTPLFIIVIVIFIISCPCHHHHHHHYHQHHHHHCHHHHHHSDLDPCNEPPSASHTQAHRALTPLLLHLWQQCHHHHLQNVFNDHFHQNLFHYLDSLISPPFQS